MRRSIVLAVDRGPYHARAVRSLSRSQRLDAEGAALRGYLRLMPRRGRFPRRYVVTASGSHAIATFIMDRDMRAEIACMRRDVARAELDAAFARGAA